MPPALLERKLRPAVVADADLVGILLAGQLGRSHARADLDALDGVDAHHGSGEILVELAVDRRAPAGGHAFGHHLDHGARPRSRTCAARRDSSTTSRRCRHRARRTDCGRPRPSPSARGRPCAADLHQRAADGHAGDDLARDRAGGDAHGGLARRGAAAAAIVADAVFLPVGEIGMAGAELVLDVGVVARRAGRRCR